ncbi:MULTISPECIES: class II fructose-bisphosphate aldolase [Tsukamurella]|uniref:Class II fructose-bisphosphate aldolase n=1 Tax=Tsukamurella strandjordii TaxID=147577 RepID=A0AA90ND87_9ACTN|nr:MULTISPECIES: class II fructose-bisphosphate aldolase [Tsukamurella]MDP0397078.1 class II fructose-bisphosphate aldolase [Tsukamurella strandjordii]GIZ96880.1 fructose-bisphosphate aldolase [Tsukamurella sp. TY48]
MTLVNLTEALALAEPGRRAIGAFNVVHLETAEAIVAAAESAELPVVLQISQNCAAYHGGLEPIALGAKALARTSTQPVVLHLDHAEDIELIDEALGLGFTSVMYDGSTLPYGENLATTRATVTKAHDLGVSVEAELGEVGGKDGAHAPGVRTDPDEAQAFWANTGVDALAVAVGSSHAMTSRTAELDVDLIARLRGTVPVPLVLHGSSGVADHGLRAAIEAGIAKVNVSTHLNAVFTGAVRDFLAANPAVVDSRKYVGVGRDALSAEAARLLLLFAGSPRE